MSVITYFRKLGRLDAACQAAGVDRSSHYRWLKEHADYAEAWDDARPEVSGMIRDEIMRRGWHGVDEPVFSAGKRALDYKLREDGSIETAVCGCQSDSRATCQICKGSGEYPLMVPAVVRRYSDPCLLALGAAYVPELATTNRQTHRLVDKEGNDRKLLDLDAVQAFMSKQPDSE